MSQAGRYIAGTGAAPIETISGNDGIPVGPDGAGDISLIGAGPITVTNTAANELTIALDGTVATTYTTDAGNAIPAAGVLNVLGGTNIDTFGAGNTITISASLPQVLTNYSVANFTPYVATAQDFYITVDTSAIAITIQLPDAPVLYRRFIIKDSAGNAAANNISVTTVSGALNIDAAPIFPMNTDWQAIELVYDGFGYQVF